MEDLVAPVSMDDVRIGSLVGIAYLIQNNADEMTIEHKNLGFPGKKSKHTYHVTVKKIS